MADWKKKITDFFEQSGEYQGRKLTLEDATIQSHKAADKFLCTVVDSALRDLAVELYKYERKAYAFRGEHSAYQLYGKISKRQ
jgi:hypothetical protein